MRQSGCGSSNDAGNCSFEERLCLSVRAVFIMQNTRALGYKLEVGSTRHEE